VGKTLVGSPNLLGAQNTCIALPRGRNLSGLVHRRTRQLAWCEAECFGESDACTTISTFFRRFAVWLSSCFVMVYRCLYPHYPPLILSLYTPISFEYMQVGWPSPRWCDKSYYRPLKNYCRFWDDAEFVARNERLKSGKKFQRHGRRKACWWPIIWDVSRMIMATYTLIRSYKYKFQSNSFSSPHG
jgi:hypothetical protein